MAQDPPPGTPFEGGRMPWSYHKYVGHDINRDMFMLNMTESRTLATFFSRVWHPQVFLAMHQMGADGARYFVPPNVEHEYANAGESTFKFLCGIPVTKLRPTT